MWLHIKSPNSVTSGDGISHAEAAKQSKSVVFSFVLSSLPRVAGRWMASSLVHFFCFLVFVFLLWVSPLVDLSLLPVDMFF